MPGVHISGLYRFPLTPLHLNTSNLDTYLFY